MDYEQFIGRVAGDLKDMIPGASVEVRDVSKFQGESYRGITVRMHSSPVAASMNLHGAYERLTGGEDYDDVLRGISDQASHALLQGRQFDISFVQDYGKARERLCMEVIPVKGNEEVLSGIPHTVMEDLAVVYRIDLNDNASVTVTDEMLDSFGITEEQLHADVLENAPKTRPASLKTMMETLGIPQEFADPSAPVLYVATTIEQIRGAGVIAYPGFLQEAAEKLGGDFFILPSSVHEVLFLPKTGNQDFREMEMIVREINSTQVAPQDRLSDNVYHYDSRDRVFELAESFEKRMAARESEKTQDGPSMLEKLREKKAEAAVQPRKPIQVKGKEAMAL